MRFLTVVFFLSLGLGLSMPSLTSAQSLNNGLPTSGDQLSFTCGTPSPAFCPTGTPCPNCTPCPQPSQCNICPTPIPSSSAVATATSPGCSGFYQMDFDHVWAYKETDVLVDQTKAQDLSCFEDIVNRVIDELPNSGLGRFDSSQVLDKKGWQLEEKTGRYFTPLLWDALLENSGLSRNSYQNNKNLIDCVGGAAGYFGVTENGHAQIGGGYDENKNTTTPGCHSGSIYLDSSCKLLNASDSRNNLSKCADSINFYTEISTPISLVWSNSYRESPSTITNFKLDPYSDKQNWMWRGSEELPLLVYDPEHTGVINSATQLFGSWTFGGNGLASLMEGATQGTPWKDGYEALSKMDKDLDGKVSGAELEDLALWFDKNQDGISQKGEVKTLSEVSVTALFYKADKKEAGAIVATKGYEREINGETVVKSSMDWMEKGLNDGFDVILDSAYSKGSMNGQSKMPAKDSTLDTSEHAKDVAPEVYGIWGWSLDLPASGSGFFSLDPAKDGIVGITLSQVGVTGATDLGTRVLFSHFSGSSIKNAKGEAEIKFEVPGENGAKLMNTARLSEDGKELFGKTVVTGSSLSESGSYEYAWKAVRLK